MLINWNYRSFIKFVFEDTYILILFLRYCHIKVPIPLSTIRLLSGRWMFIIKCKLLIGYDDSVNNIEELSGHMNYGMF